MKNKILTSLGFISCVLIPSCGSKGSYTVPEFAKAEKGLSIASYAGPTVAKWRLSNNNPNTLTKEHILKLHEAGFNKMVALYEGGSTANGANTYETIQKRSEKAEKDAMIALNAISEAADEVGEGFKMDYFVRDWSFYGLPRNFKYGFSPNIETDEQYKQVIDNMFTEDTPYLNHKYFGGNFTFDEPTVQEMDRIAVQCQLYYDRMEELGVEKYEAFVNLLPDYAGGNGLSEDGGVSYEEYIDHYFDTIAPILGYVCYDYYPLYDNPFVGSYVRNTFLNNLNIVAKRCKEQNIELRTFLQSIGNWTGMRDLVSIGDLRLQIYSAMAFGSHEFIYYEYANEHTYNDEDGGFALFNIETEEYNWTYDAAKIVNNEVHAFEDAFLSYNWDGVMYKNADPMFDNPAFSYLDGDALTSHKRVKFVNVEQDTFMGTFKHKETGDDAFMVVNYTDPYFGLNNEVTLDFEGADALLMYRLGQKMIVELPSSGKYTMKLYPGEGRFIIPLK